MIIPLQIRAARVLAGISQQDLAKLAKVGLGTVKRIEAGGTEVSGTAQTVARLQRALEATGIVFIDQSDDRGPGVRLRDPLP